MFRVENDSLIGGVMMLQGDSTAAEGEATREVAEAALWVASGRLAKTSKRDAQPQAEHPLVNALATDAAG